MARRWHRCDRYWNTGLECPLEEEEDDDDDDEGGPKRIIPIRSKVPKAPPRKRARARAVADIDIVKVAQEIADQVPVRTPVRVPGGQGQPHFGQPRLKSQGGGKTSQPEPARPQGGATFEPGPARVRHKAVMEVAPGPRPLRALVETRVPEVARAAIQATGVGAMVQARQTRTAQGTARTVTAANMRSGEVATARAMAQTVAERRAGRQAWWRQYVAPTVAAGASAAAYAVWRQGRGGPPRPQRAASPQRGRLTTRGLGSRPSGRVGAGAGFWFNQQRQLRHAP